jgi:hypothetical protein
MMIGSQILTMDAQMVLVQSSHVSHMRKMMLNEPSGSTRTRKKELDSRVNKQGIFEKTPMLDDDMDAKSFPFKTEVHF